MTGMRLSVTALAINGAASILQYLVAQQVGGGRAALGQPWTAVWAS
jgi:hypothetical protein